MNLRPSLNKSPLRLRETTPEAFNRLDREHRRLVLVVRVKMWAVVLTSGFDEHPNDDSEEPRELRHARTLASFQETRADVNRRFSASRSHGRFFVMAAYRAWMIRKRR